MSVYEGHGAEALQRVVVVFTLVELCVDKLAPLPDRLAVLQPKCPVF